MEYKKILEKALIVREKFSQYEIKNTGQEWTKEQILQGFVVDVGDLVKICMAKEGYRHIEDADQKLSHELSDCLWSIIILAHKYDIDLEKSFIETMDELSKKLDIKNKK